MSACAPSPAFTVQLAAPPRATPENTVLRGLEDGRGADLDLARRTLARSFELTAGHDAIDAPTRAVADLPAPPGTAWVALDDGVAVVPAFTSPLGRLALVRIDDGADVSLADVESAARAETAAGAPALRLAFRADRRAAFERLCARERGGVLLFVTGGRADLAVRIGEGLPDGKCDVLLAGLAPGEDQRLLAGLNRGPP